jgi:hypothetical protein
VKKAMSKRNRFRTAAGIVLSAALLLTVFGFTEKGMQVLGLGRLSESNETYLNASFKRSLQTFAVLTAVKTGLGVVEGSEVGVGFGIQIGDVVQAAYDYVDMAWRTVLISMAVLTGTRFVLQAARIFDQWFLAAFILFLLLMLLCRWTVPKFPALRRFFRDAAFVAALVAVMLYVALPASVTLGRSLSRKITAPSMSEAETGFSRFRTEVFPESAQPKTGFWSKIVETKDKLAEIVSFLKTRTNEMIEWVIKLIAGYTFDCIVFPMGLFFAFYGLFRFLVRALFDARRSQSLREDLGAVLRRTGSGNE